MENIIIIILFAPATDLLFVHFNKKTEDTRRGTYVYNTIINSFCTRLKLNTCSEVNFNLLYKC